MSTKQPLKIPNPMSPTKADDVLTLESSSKPHRNISTPGRPKPSTLNPEALYPLNLPTPEDPPKVESHGSGANLRLRLRKLLGHHSFRVLGCISFFWQRLIEAGEL